MLTSAQGRVADCRNCILIMTSNVGAELMTATGMGFAADRTPGDAAVRTAVTAALKKLFRPEFLNRVDETVIFRPLSKESIRAIAGRFLEEIRRRLAGMGIDAVFEDSAVDWFAENGYDAAYGARYLKRLIVAEAEDPIAHAIISGGLAEGGGVNFRAADGNLQYAIKAPVKQLPQGEG